MRTVAWALCVTCLFGWSCGGGSDEAPPRPALEIQGSLDADPANLADRPIPALLYSDGTSRLWLQQLEVHGTFPSELDVAAWEPPPEGAMSSVGHLDEPPIAVGYLTAVADPHPDFLRFVTTSTRLSLCETRRGETVPVSCEVTARWCAGDLICYSEQHTCPEANSPLELCELQSSRGDAELEEARPWATFAGVSTNYVFVYVSEALPAASVTASLLAAPNGLAAGFHILAMRDLADSEYVERGECWNGALDAAVNRLNESDGTSLGWHEVMRPCADENSWTSIESPLCALPQDERDATRARLEALSWRTRLEAGCQLTFRALEPIAATKRLDVHLSNIAAPALVQLF